MGWYIFYLFLTGVFYYIVNLLTIAFVSACSQDRDLVWLKLTGIILYYVNKIGCICLALYWIYESLDLLLRKN